MIVNEKKSVLVLTSSYPKRLREPSSIFLHYLSQALSGEGWQMTVLAPNFPGGEPREEMDGVEVVRYNYFLPGWQTLCYGSGVPANLRANPLLWLQVPFFLSAMRRAAASLICRRKFDLMHAHWIIPQGAVARSLRRQYRIPVVLTAHGADAFGFQTPLGRSMKRFGLQAANACVTNSQYTKAMVDTLLPGLNSRVIPMGIWLEEYEKSQEGEKIRRQLGIQGPLLLFVGRLVEKKGAEFLVRALPAVLKGFPRTTLLVIGEGTLRKGLENLASSLGIVSSIRFLGRLPNQDLPAYFQAADVFIGPSIVDEKGDTEGLGIVFLEAAAAKLPIIGTGVGGSGEFLEEGVTGILVPQRDSQALGGAICRLLADPEFRSRLGYSARQKVAEGFTWRQVAAQYSSLFAEVLRNFHATPRTSSAGRIQESEVSTRNSLQSASNSD
jgi:glycosyltransferase involved in cell wall biosynthesis